MDDSLKADEAVKEKIIRIQSLKSSDLNGNSPSEKDRGANNHNHNQNQFADTSSNLNNSNNAKNVSVQPVRSASHSRNKISQENMESKSKIESS